MFHAREMTPRNLWITDRATLVSGRAASKPHCSSGPRVLTSGFPAFVDNVALARTGLSPERCRRILTQLTYALAAALIPRPRKSVPRTPHPEEIS